MHFRSDRLFGVDPKEIEGRVGLGPYLEHFIPGSPPPRRAPDPQYRQESQYISKGAKNGHPEAEILLVGQPVSETVRGEVHPKDALRACVRTLIAKINVWDWNSYCDKGERGEDHSDNGQDQHISIHLSALPCFAHGSSVEHLGR